jgi:hypothetical protein
MRPRWPRWPPRYRNDALGDIVVSRRDGKARIDVGRVLV